MSATTNPEPQGRPFPWRCANCFAEAVVPAVIDYTARVKHDGVVHEFVLRGLEAPVCQNCGATVITTAVDDHINDALRARLRLLTSEQIRQGMARLGLQEQALAERLGVAPETIARWLDGSLIQPRATDNLLRLFFALPQVREVLQGASQDPPLGTVG